MSRGPLRDLLEDVARDLQRVGFGIPLTEDPVVDRVIGRLVERSARGMRTYGVSMAANPAGLLEWIQHAQEELLDGVLYLERVKDELCALEEEDAPAGALPLWSWGVTHPGGVVVSRGPDQDLGAYSLLRGELRELLQRPGDLVERQE